MDSQLNQNVQEQPASPVVGAGQKPSFDIDESLARSGKPPTGKPGFVASGVSSLLNNSITQNAWLGGTLGLLNVGRNLLNDYTDSPEMSQARKQEADVKNVGYAGVNSSASGRVDTSLGTTLRQAQPEDQLFTNQHPYMARALATAGNAFLPYAALIGVSKVGSLYDWGLNKYQKYKQDQFDKNVNRDVAPVPPEHIVIPQYGNRQIVLPRRNQVGVVMPQNQPVNVINTAKNGSLPNNGEQQAPNHEGESDLLAFNADNSYEE